MTSNDDTVRSFLSMGAQIAEELRRRLDEAAAKVGQPQSDVDVDQIVEAVLAQVKDQIATEVERVITMLGVAREDELASLRSRIENLERK
jgi:ATPase subunit of ABC transporter with duplicated ATPase domains